MTNMFRNATNFNNGGEPLQFNIKNVAYMNNMFDGATSFNFLSVVAISILLQI